MRWIGQARRAFDMMCERALSRFSHGSLLSDKQMIQDFIAETKMEIEATKLLCMYAAWHMDEHGSSASRLEIAMIKVYGTRMLYNAIDRAIQVHGALGYTTDLPLEEMYRVARASRLVDGADEVHKMTIAPPGVEGLRGRRRSAVGARAHSSGRGRGAVRPPPRRVDGQPLAACRRVGSRVRPARTGCRDRGRPRW